MWVNLINLPNQQIKVYQQIKYKDIKSCSCTKNRLLQDGDKNELRRRIHHYHL